MKSLNFTPLYILWTTIFTALLMQSTACFALAATPPVDFEKYEFQCDIASGAVDFRSNNPFVNNLRKKVVGAHFTVGVRRGKYGNTGRLEDDLNYVLRIFPNHPQALLGAARAQMKPNFRLNSRGRIDYLLPTKECYFKEALRIGYNDSSVHLVIAVFYHEFGNLSVARRHYQQAIKLSPNNPEAHYNFGLLLTDLNSLDDALIHAKKAYALGYPLDGLKNRLVKLKMWSE